MGHPMCLSGKDEVLILDPHAPIPLCSSDLGEQRQPWQTDIWPQYLTLLQALPEAHAETCNPSAWVWRGENTEGKVL